MNALGAPSGSSTHPSSFIPHPSDLLRSRIGRTIVSASILLLFLATRIPLLLVRDVFFDELFTHWICAKPFAEIIGALRLDSGPPLYYFLIHAIGNPPAIAARVVSLVCAAVALIAILLSRRLGTPRFLAAALLAAYPPAILFATDARSYALCAMFVTIAVLAIDAHRDWVAVAALVLAAYAHYYGLFFFPALLLSEWGGLPPLSAAGPKRRRAAALRRVAPFAVACALFAAWLPIAMHQPPQATQWLAGLQWWQPFAGISFAARYPESLFAPATWSVVLIALFLFAVAAMRVNRFAAMTAIPIAIVLAFGAAGRSAYFPMRFESVLAPPLVLWLATSLASMRRSLRIAIAALLIAIGLGTAVNGILDHARRPLDDYRAAALFLARNAPANATVVATGYLYLETVSLRPAIAFPAEQALHPGWRATPSAGRRLPGGTFLWIGERLAPELRGIASVRRVEPLFVNQRAMVARIR